MRSNPILRRVCFLAGLLIPIPLLAWVDHFLVRQFERAYWSLPRELGFWVGWPLLSLAIWFVLRRTRLEPFSLGMAWSGALVVLAMVGYLGLLVVGYLGDVLFR
jgi:hypothetical protein